MSTVMAKQSHTPGPWKIYVGKHPDPAYARRVEVFPVAEDICGGSPEECDANARLIAAAPELLEALKNLLDCSSLNEDDMEPEERELIQDAVAAIAKAEGR